MSDINRVPIPYGSQPVSNKPKNVTNKTIRIAIKLPQSNEDTCPEYNYKDELDAAKKGGSVKNTENGNMLDMFEDDDGDVMRIAMQMEEKYGKSVSVSKKRRRGRKDDYADIGMGYDESDSFIDNTHGYDEIVPQNITTVHGGFYINCGALEFKTDDEDSAESSSGSRSPSPKNGKRSIDESEGEDEEEEEGSSQQRKKKVKVDSSCNGMQKALKKKLFSPNKILKKKRSSNILKKTVKDLLKEKRIDLNMTVQTSETDLNNSVLTEGKNNVENGKNLSNSITDAIESVVKASDEPILGDRISSQVTDEVKQVQLPENLPNNIAEVISKIKETGANSTSGNKFTDEMNNLLLSLEKKCKCLGKPSKTKVYEHLSYCIKIDKQILIQHCKQLALKDEDKKIKSLLQKLKAEIDKVMPSIVSNYEKECELVFEKRTLLQLQNQEGGEEKRRSIGRPKRKFQWNDQTRKFLKDTATIKKRSYLQQGHSKEKWEDELTTFLKDNVIQLWPEGWMTMTTLTKVCNKLFNDPKTANQSPFASAKKENKNTATSNVAPAYPNIFTSPVVQGNKTYSKTNPVEKSSEIIGKLEKTGKEHKEQALKENVLKEQIEKPEEDKKNNNGSAFLKVDYEKAQVAPSRPKDLNQEANAIPKIFSKPKESSQEAPKFVSGCPPRPKDLIQEIKDAPKFPAKSKDCVQETKDFARYSQPKDLKQEVKEAVKMPPSAKPISYAQEIKEIKLQPGGVPTKDLVQEIKDAAKFSHVNIIELESASNILPKTKPKLNCELEFPSISILKSENNGRNCERTDVIEKQLNAIGAEDNHRNISDGDDIQKVMERLKNLQKMFEGSSSSNTAVSPKASSGASKNNVDPVTSSFQDEFQKQLFNALGNLPPSSSKSNYKCS